MSENENTERRKTEDISSRSPFLHWWRLALHPKPGLVVLLALKDRMQ